MLGALQGPHIVSGMPNNAPKTYEVLSAFSSLSTLGHETVFVACLGSQARTEQILRGSQEDGSGDLRFGVGDELVGAGA